MSRVAKKPIALPKGVEFKVENGQFTVKGGKGSLGIAKPDGVDVKVEDGQLTLVPAGPENVALAGTLRSILFNMVTGVSEGFQQGKDLSLSLGFSHPVVYVAPEGITLETPVQTEILVKGSDKQQVGEVAAKIRAFRPPEPYKGKGVRYSGEKINIKEAKKA